VRIALPGALAAILLVCMCPFLGASDPMNADAQIARARALEHEFDAAATYAAWERVIDSCSCNAGQMRLAGSRLRALTPLVPRNTDLDEANVWRAKAFICRTLDMSWTPKGAEEEKHVSVTMTDEDVELVVAGFMTFTDLVFRCSRGQLRVKAEVEVIDQPLTRMSGGGPFWLGPWDVEELIDGRYEPGTLDSVFTYVKMGDSKENSAPAAMFGGTYGGDLGPGGAGWTGIMWMPGWLKGDGEVELHEWLHQVDWAFDKRLGYAPGIVPSSDGGRRVGEEGGDKCYRRPPEAGSWLPFYEHIMRDHVTSKMWQEARCRPWEDEAAQPTHP